jgi:hypothetical protein
MSSNVLMDILNKTIDTIFKKCLVKLIRTLFGYLISTLFVLIPRFFYFLMTLGKGDELCEKQKRVRSKLVNEEDPSSPYRAVETLEKLETQPEKRVETLSFIPDLCLKRYADKQTMGVRQILNVEEEKQSNGKIHKKVFFLI